jgi:hypothetical protein
MIDELEVRKLDNRFGTKSQIFQCTNTIVITTPLDDWRVRVTNKKYKGVCIYHRNKFGRTDKFHIQGYKNYLSHAYQHIYSHKRWMCITNTSDTYNKGNIR